MNECGCDRVRDALGGLVLGGTAVAWEGGGCNCNFAPFDTVTLHLSAKTGGFTSWPDSIDIPCFDPAPCSFSGVILLPGIDPNAMAEFEYVDTVIPSWTIRLGTDLFTPTTTAFAGNSPWPSFTSFFTTLISVGYSGACNTNPMPGNFGSFTTALGDSVTITISIS